MASTNWRPCAVLFCLVLGISSLALVKRRWQRTICFVEEETYEACATNNSDGREGLNVGQPPTLTYGRPSSQELSSLHRDALEATISEKP